MSVVVVLTPSEAWMAAYAGVHRRLRAIFRGRQHRYGRGHTDEWRDDILACAAELAASRALDRHWSDGADPDYLGDVGSIPPLIHVRHTLRDDGRLILREADPGDGIFVLVTGTIPAFTVHGWITGAEGKADDPVDLHNGRPKCWMIKQTTLRDLEELRR